jgi:hypothetical protein
LLEGTKTIRRKKSKRAMNERREEKNCTKENRIIASG